MFKPKFVVLVTMALIVATASCTPGATTATTAPVVAPTQAAPAATAAPLAKSIVYTNTGGDWGTCSAKAFEDTFTKNYGVKVIEGPAVDDGQLRAMVDTNTYNVDVVFPSVGFVVDPLGAKYLEPIDYSQIQKADLVPGTFTPYAVAQDLFSFAFGFRTDKGPAPTKWEDFFDTTNFPGKRGLVSWDYTTVIIGALLADGVAPDKMLPLDYNRAFKKLDTIKKDIVWYDTGSAGQDLLVSGEVRFIQIYANRITSARDSGAPVNILWDGQIIQADYIGVPKGDPNAATAMKFVANDVSKDVNGLFTLCETGAPSNTKSTINPAKTNDFPTSHLDLRYVVSSSPEITSYVAQHVDEISNAFNTWKGK
jgi:putative spermidine/putrescine transport system substrate-binding protein